MRVYIGPYPDLGDPKVEVQIDRYDTWSMDSTLAHIILPMLKQLKETKHGSPRVDVEDVPEHLQLDGTSRNESMQLDMFADDEYDELAWNIVHRRWDWVIDEMIWAFEQKFEDWESQFHTGEHDTWMQPLDKDNNPIGEPYKWGDFGEDREEIPGVESYQMIKGPNDTSHFDVKGHIAYQERISNGFRLFGKYYEGLWD